MTEARRDELPNLPLPRSDFVGRAAEIAAIRRLLIDVNSALATLVGPAGVGKTRLALETARALVSSFADGNVVEANDFTA